MCLARFSAASRSFFERRTVIFATEAESTVLTQSNIGQTGFRAKSEALSALFPVEFFDPAFGKELRDVWKNSLTR